MALRTVVGLSAAIWAYLGVGHGRFWRTSVRLPDGVDPAEWPSVTAVVPARDEAAMLPRTLPTLLRQDYPGRWQVLVVDDDSDDATASIARDAGAQVVCGSGPPPGWVGKVAAMAAGVEQAGKPDYFLFTDADIAYPPAR